MIKFEHHGGFANTKRLFRKGLRFRIEPILDHYGQEGVIALSAATPKRSGKTANSWSYSVSETDTGKSLDFNNSNVQKGYANVALLLQYGHGTGTGGYVEGQDYINPALQPIFDEIARYAWKEVTGK